MLGNGVLYYDGDGADGDDEGEYVVGVQSVRPARVS
jgi:hypothetical protein